MIAFNTIFLRKSSGGKGEGAEAAPSLVKGRAVGYEARPDLLQKEGVKRTAPTFRKSYGYEAWCDSIAAGQNLFMI